MGGHSFELWHRGGYPVFNVQMSMKLKHLQKNNVSLTQTPTNSVFHNKFLFNKNKCFGNVVKSSLFSSPMILIKNAEKQISLPISFLLIRYFNLNV